MMMFSRFRKRQKERPDKGSVNQAEKAAGSWMEDFLAVPVFEDDFDNRAGRLLHSLLILAFPITLTIGLYTLFTSRAQPYLFVILSVLGIEGLSFFLLRNHRLRLAGFIFVSTLWFLVIIPPIFLGGLESPITFLSLPVVLLSGLLLGELFGAAFVGFTGLAYGIILLFENENLLPANSTFLTPDRYWLYLGASLITVAMLSRLSLRSIQEELQRSHQNELDLALSNRKLETLRSNLESRVGERTQDLQRRALQLQVAVEVGQAVSAMRDLDQMLSRVTELISDRFGFYHAGIFLLDDSGEFAVLRAANSPGGKQMLAKGYSLKVGEVGIVGYVTKYSEPRIALDVGMDAIHFKNPFLPDTRSEMALPLSVGDRVLGALDVQSNMPAAFTEEDVAVLQVLANQVAIAIENVDLLEETQAALELSRRAYGELSREAWLERLHSQPLGFHRDSHGLTPIDQPEQSDVKDADDKRIAVPIQVRGQTIGFIHASKPDRSGEWTVEEAALLNTLVDQLGVALDSARLHEETQERAERERMIGEITSHMRETLDLETVLQTAAREMRHALDLAEVEMRLGADPSTENLEQERTDEGIAA
jgi:GAF domain-containing protein